MISHYTKNKTQVPSLLLPLILHALPPVFLLNMPPALCVIPYYVLALLADFLFL